MTLCPLLWLPLVPITKGQGAAGHRQLEPIDWTNRLDKRPATESRNHPAINSLDRQPATYNLNKQAGQTEKTDNLSLDRGPATDRTAWGSSLNGQPI